MYSAICTAHSRYSGRRKKKAATQSGPMRDGGDGLRCAGAARAGFTSGLTGPGMEIALCDYVGRRILPRRHSYCVQRGGTPVTELCTKPRRLLAPHTSKGHVSSFLSSSPPPSPYHLVYLYCALVSNNHSSHILALLQSTRTALSLGHLCWLEIFGIHLQAAYYTAIMNAPDRYVWQFSRYVFFAMS